MTRWNEREAYLRAGSGGAKPLRPMGVSVAAAARPPAAPRRFLLFASDARMREIQREYLDRFRDVPLTRGDMRREQLEDERELRAHARWRQMAWLVALSPILLGAGVALVHLLTGA